MSEIVLVRQLDEPIQDVDKLAARRVLFGIIDGLGDRGKSQWRRFFNMVLRLEPGEIVTITTHKARSGPFHRRHMLMEARVFDSQERFDNFDVGFRDWLKVGAGHCNWFPGPKGGIFPVPKSISYKDMEEGEMREFHAATVAFLRTDHAVKTLWPKLPAMQRMQAIDAILASVGE